LTAEGIEIVTGAKISRVERDPGRAGRRLSFTVGDDERSIAVDEVLVATGRRPNTAGLGLERAGIRTDDRGSVIVGAGPATTNPRVWAAGDVTPSPQFVYLAAYHGKLVTDNLFGGMGRTVDLTALPRITFTTPSVAAVGLGESEARDAGHAVKVST